MAKSQSERLWQRQKRLETEKPDFGLRFLRENDKAKRSKADRSTKFESCIGVLICIDNRRARDTVKSDPEFRLGNPVGDKYMDGQNGAC